jgi:hypothetical protein
MLRDVSTQTPESLYKPRIARLPIPAGHSIERLIPRMQPPTSSLTTPKLDPAPKAKPVLTLVIDRHIQMTMRLTKVLQTPQNPRQADVPP